MPDEHVSRFYTPFLKRLVKKDWFTSRISAASLVHVAYRRLPESEKSQYTKLFIGLCCDDTPMVRRVAAQHLGRVAKNFRVQEVAELVTVFAKLAADDQNSVAQSVAQRRVVSRSLKFRAHTQIRMGTQLSHTN
jgi:serine/threonine-protein phosphatase 2A regulatory subunit A